MLKAGGQDGALLLSEDGPPSVRPALARTRATGAPAPNTLQETILAAFQFSNQQGVLSVFLLSRKKGFNAVKIA